MKAVTTGVLTNLPVAAWRRRYDRRGEEKKEAAKQNFSKK
jgi:hypothetical protein